MDVNKVRRDFPILQKKINEKYPIYFDNACQTLRPKQVIDKILEYYQEYPACGGRSIHKWGDRTTQEYQKSRELVAKLIGAKPNEIIFTKNTTEGLNLVANSFGLKKGDVVLTSDREHNSNLVPWQVLVKKRKIVHKIVPSKDSIFDLEKYQEMIKGVKLVSMVFTSNIDGYTLPVKEIIKIAHENNSLVMLDGAQAVPHKEIDVKKLDVDFLAFSGHKMLGPSGVGVLYGKYHLLEKLEPFIVGGDTVKNTTYSDHELLDPPEKFEAGLQNYSGIIGLGEAVRYLDRIGLKNIEKHEIQLNKLATEGLLAMGAKIVGVQEAEMRSGIVSFLLENIHPHDICMILDSEFNIMIRSGSHCVHSWFHDKFPSGSARVSFYLYNTKDEVEIFLDAISNIKKEFR
ncbi:MAG: cysteine desulfurase [Candidatus Aenigmatarchaeota archaeon]